MYICGCTDRPEISHTGIGSANCTLFLSLLSSSNPPAHLSAHLIDFLHAGRQHKIAPSAKCWGKLAAKTPHLDKSCASMTELRSPYNENNMIR